MSGALKGLVGVLLAANIALYLWAAGDNGEGRPAADAVADVNPDAMQLLHEIPAPAAATAVDISPSGLESSATARPTARSCHRIGPFKGGQNWAAAVAWMRAQNFDHRAIRSARRPTQVVRVALGPFASRAAAAASLAALKAAGIEHFVEVDAAGQAVVSLGYFTQAKLAEKFVAHLRARDIDARARPDYRDLGPHDWLETAVDAAGRDALQAHTWPEPGAVVAEVNCTDSATPPSPE